MAASCWHCAPVSKAGSTALPPASSDRSTADQSCCSTLRARWPVLSVLMAFLVSTCVDHSLGMRAARETPILAIESAGLRRSRLSTFAPSQQGGKGHGNADQPRRAGDQEGHDAESAHREPSQRHAGRLAKEEAARECRYGSPATI